MRVTLNIWSLLCPLSPFFPPSLSLSVSSQLNQTKGSVKLCLSEQRSVQPARQKNQKTTKGHFESCSTFHFDTVLSTNDEKCSKQPISPRENTSPAGASTGVYILAEALLLYQAPLFYMWIFALHHQGSLCHWEFKNRRASTFQHRTPPRQSLMCW